MNSQEIYNEFLLNSQEVYDEFLAGFKRSAGFLSTKYANEVWTKWSCQLSDSARAAIEREGYTGGLREGGIFARLNTPAAPARRAGLDGSIQENK